MPNSPQNYQQKNIYIQNFIRSKNYDFSPAYSELIGRLCAVESALTMRESAVGFCAELLAALKGSSFQPEIDRLCLAYRVGLTNELIVVDSVNSERGGENLMVPGYRCFVRSDSSLMALREGEIRIYDSATRITDSFEKRSQPAQRSIAYIVKMGFSSGVCHPLHFAGNLRGFMFINSAKEGLFSALADEDYAILNLMGIIAKAGLIGELIVDYEYMEMKKQPYAVLSSQLFDEDEFAAQLQAMTKALTAENWRPEVATVGSSDFLLVPSTIAFIAIKVCQALHRSVSAFPKRIRVMNLGNEIVQIRIPVSDEAVPPTIEIYKENIRALESRLAFLKASLVPGINEVSIQIPYDPIFREREDILYSVL